MNRLLLASTNPHKTREFAAILGPLHVVSDLRAHPSLPPVEETGATFAENALLKATQTSGWVDGLVVADDSGLEVDALGGAPGVRSARYAGEGATDEQNRIHLLSELERLEVPGEPTARFVCVLALAEHGAVLATVTGTVEGRIIRAPAGSSGFGYDPLFVPLGYQETFAELPQEVKNRESHRARALARLIPVLEEVFRRRSAGI